MAWSASSCSAPGDRPRRLRAVPLDVERGLGRAEPLRDARDVLDGGVGVDDRELEGGGSAVEDEYVHALLPVPEASGRDAGESSPPRPSEPRSGVSFWL